MFLISALEDKLKILYNPGLGIKTTWLRQAIERAIPMRSGLPLC